MSSTAKDIEQQKTRKVNRELKELLGILTGAKKKLGDALRFAKHRTKGGLLHAPQPINQLVQVDNAQEEEETAPDRDIAMPELPSVFQELPQQDQPQLLSPPNFHVTEPPTTHTTTQDSQPTDDSPSVFEPLVVDPSPMELTVTSLPGNNNDDKDAKPNGVEMVAV